VETFLLIIEMISKIAGIINLKRLIPAQKESEFAD
jgi:hypothetical protein